MQDSKNIMVTGQLPTGTFKIEVSKEEIISVDPRILMAMNEKLNPRPLLKYGEN